MRPVILGFGMHSKYKFIKAIMINGMTKINQDISVVR